jgi:hypothetical protein
VKTSVHEYLSIKSKTSLTPRRETTNDPIIRLDSTTQKPGSSRRRGIVSVEKLGRIKANKDLSLSTSIENVLSGSDAYHCIIV